ncbi:M15 family metallopeptidase [Granulicatella sp. 19428wC4_WM01]|nr:M15 family metallopeptidase [Granulicatella sp. 19428wC4_WM01]TFU94222.1 D-alanyl-D-alanine carboxypeptidase family protein [Granulicatella sp. WM01]
MMTSVLTETTTQTESTAIKSSIVTTSSTEHEQSLPIQKRQHDEYITSSQTETSQEPKQQSNESTPPAENKVGMADLSLGYSVIVNKKHALPADYAPGEDEQARVHLVKLITDMQNLGYDISNSYSGYRSYYVQENLYNNYVYRDGKQAADTYSARPGHSEHQTGLAYDLKTSNGELLGDGNMSSHTEAVNWLATHAHLYGFIIRYQAGKEYVTGYSAEPWHLRYVGSVEHATQIYQSGLSLEEYYGVPGGDYAQ